MSQVKVRVSAPTIKKLKAELSSPSTQMRMGHFIIEQMRSALKAGLSPVQGIRRFAAYKNPPLYPGDLKAARPVNLELSGSMLDEMTPFLRGEKLFIGYPRETKNAVVARAHQTGTKHMAQRRFMPASPGEKFNATITKRLRDYFARILSDILRRK
jgi:hypothetical protein